MSIKYAIKNALRCFTLVLVALSLSTPALAAEDGKKPKRKTYVMSKNVGKKVQKAFEAYQEDRIPDAISMLEEIEAKQPFDVAFVNRLLGNMYAGQKGQAKKAIGKLEKAVELDVLNKVEQEQAIKLLADLNLQEANYQKALNGYKEWMAFAGREDPEVYLRISQSYYQLKQLDKIIEPADRAIALYKKPKESPYLMKISSYYERKMYREASEVASTLVKLFPTDKRWWVQLGQFYLLDENFERALSSYELAYKQGFLEKANQYTALAQLYAAYGIPVKAAQVQNKYLKAGVIEKDEKSLASLANYYHQGRDFKDAANTYSEVAKMTQDPDYYKKVGDLLLMTEDYKGAISAFKKSLELGTKQSDSITMSLVEANFYSGNYKSAYKYAKEAKKIKKYRQSASGWMSYIEDTAKRKKVSI
ncbi:tetratricopeptide repeat protein [Catenovulum sp. SM1970]|uniref:tetratricopeptide repeat protein n=1 Tax=Marinifaba aquimaris TaxID=2741323 RepID=UPI001571A034|nr:tetratricopeptide repeat protein [Marinifaba aquimaris]NTS75264.1 tetratricopeptide repeat protein [Marinifaba aquimaris]